MLELGKKVLLSFFDDNESFFAGIQTNVTSAVFLMKCPG